MREVFRVERDLVNLLEVYARKLEEKLNRINSYMQVIHFKAIINILLLLLVLTALRGQGLSN